MNHLKKERTTLKKRITRIKTYLDGLDANAPPSPAELTTKRDQLQSYWLEYKSLHSEILKASPDEEPVDADDDDLMDMEDKCTTMVIQFKQYALPELHFSSSSNGESSVSTPSGTVTPVIMSDAHGTVKLPKMDLPTFTGNQLEWQSFRDLFKSIIHSNSKISDSQKLHYLKSSLRDDARALLHSIEICDANYKIAWDLMEDRYNNERNIIHCHLKSLFSQPAMTGESAASLRKLADTTTKHVRALKSVGLDTSSTNWEPIIVFIITERMDTDSRRFWELNTPGKEFPTLKQLTEFLDQRCRALDATSSAKPNQPRQQTTYSNQKSTTKSHYASSATKSSCPVCKSEHFVFQCPELLKLDSRGKSELAKKLHLCFNCLRRNHSVEECKSESRCRQCNKKHHTLLHYTPKLIPALATQAPEFHPISTTTHYGKQGDDNFTQVLLATALVQVRDGSGSMQICRALMDIGSMSSLISESCMQRLGLKRSRGTGSISGIGGQVNANSRGSVNLELKSTISSFTINVNALVLSKVTSELPNAFVSIKNWSHLHNLQLADPTFYNPGPIDILIGADAYEDIVEDGKIQTPGLPSARNTRFGWILSGKVTSNFANPIISHITTVDISEQLRLFWELEEVIGQQHLTLEEQQCESHFHATHFRDATGRFVTAIPFKQEDPSIGQSKTVCIKRLLQVENKLEKNPEYRLEYNKFMDQYLDLGHMEAIPVQQQFENPTKTNYLPHHFVLKESSTTTSFRVVFDASAKTTNGNSLNQQMMVGPRLQDDIYAILLRFRLHKYAFTADIAKMYRQIRVPPKDADFQRILWRKTPQEQIQEFRLLTVTYGTASAPYLATKCLQQLAKDEGHRFPLAKEVTLRDFYVDDVMSGANSINSALSLQRELIELMHSGGFQLRKWSANHPQLLESLPPEFRETSLPMSITEDDSIKALGLHWCPSGDFFFFKVNLPSVLKIITKRNILSETARLYDPLGWMSPATILAKIMIQKLWLLGVSWDDSLPEELQHKWTEFRTQLRQLGKIQIRRFVNTDDGNQFQLHGFCDASQQAYCAVIYIRVKNHDGNISTHLLTAKTKVAPVKQVSIPRLELCGAVLLSRLISKVKSLTCIKWDSVHAWSDSTTALAWISQHPGKWTTFVANRSSEIQSLVPPSHWRYVPSTSNPADCGSRGMLPANLVNFSLWWTGPDWLSSEEIDWPSKHADAKDDTNSEKKIKAMATIAVAVEWNLVQRYSSITKLTRVTAFCQRFIRNARLPESQRLLSPLSPLEVQGALHFWIRHVQQFEFGGIVDALKRGIQKPHQLLPLAPFLDSTGLLRVGGRLNNSQMSFTQKHPIVLPKKHHLTWMIIMQEHIRLLHAGPQSVLSAIQQKYWIVNGRNIIRQLLRKCVQCIRERANTCNQMMGNLPSYRTQQIRPFMKTGVDYAGPYSIKSLKGRGGKITKSYVSLFVCMCTKAIHLELVTDLTTDAFLAALRRFMSRRGKPSDLFSDNGTNFVGADAELRELADLVQSKLFNDSLADNLSSDGVNWHFIPAKAPHFGGLWEAGIKSTKRHLRKVIGSQLLTFEEFYTFLTQVEAVLNSRPLTPLSSDPSDLTALTPAHFLIGEPLVTIPEPDLQNLHLNRLSRWQLVQQMTQQFWKRWHLEYLCQLQQRSKWTTTCIELKTDDIVLVKEDNSPPLHWRMARVVQLHPGKDNITRVVTLKSSTGFMKRPITKLCPLLTD